MIQIAQRPSPLRCRLAHGTWAGFVYVAFVIDVFARRIVGWWVNALAESVIGLFKTEVAQRLGPWRNLHTVEVATLTWVDWFNTRRLLEPIGLRAAGRVRSNVL